MLKKIGYACINLHLKPQGFKDCRLNSIYKYGIEYLRNIIIHNLIHTKNILKWNIKNDIYMYRVTSRLFPLVTHFDILRDFKWRWKNDKQILNNMDDIKDIVERNNIRLSMHPDQFTVLNSLNDNVVDNSILNLKYHYDVMKKLGGTDIIIHTGGVYGDKKGSIERFIKNFSRLNDNMKNMIRLENDDVSYDIQDVLYISSKIDIPIVLDIHHHLCNNDKNINIQNKIIEINETWRETGLIPKIHISSGKMSITDRRHHDYIKYEDFKYILKIIDKIDFDLMVEAKKKEKAVLKLRKNWHLNF